ncbi:MAG: hypothetical protein DMG58_34820 [Acidobacteria bacterium]|nr:MAG: hypothetical protein DMG58_34820 [Acidobacteriota bacterium]
MKVIFENLNGASGSVLAAVLNSLWQAAAVALVAWPVLKLTPRINAATRFVVWWAVLAVITVLPIAGTLTTVWQPRPEAVVSELVSSAESSDLSAGARPIAATQATISRATLLPIELRVETWPLWIFTVWSIAFLYHIARIVCSYKYLQGVKQRSRPPTRELRLNFDEWLLACHVCRPLGASAWCSIRIGAQAADTRASASSGPFPRALTVRPATSRHERENRRYQRTAQTMISSSKSRHLNSAGRVLIMEHTAAYQTRSLSFAPQPDFEHIARRLTHLG